MEKTNRILSDREIDGLSMIAASTGLDTVEVRSLLDSHKALHKQLRKVEQERDDLGTLYRREGALHRTALREIDELKES